MSFRNALWFVFAASLFSLAMAIVNLNLACTKPDAQTVVDVTTKIADGVCKEEAKQPSEPDWVAVACAIEAPASGIAHVVMPRAQWDTVRGKKAPPCTPQPCTSGKPPQFDAGPGK